MTPDLLRRRAMAAHRGGIGSLEGLPMKTITTLAAALLACAATANAGECEYRGGKQDCRQFLREMEKQLHRQQRPRRQQVPDVGYMNGVPIEQFEQQQQLQQQVQQLQQQQQMNDLAIRLQNAGRYLQQINPAPAAPTVCTFQHVGATVIRTCN
jgi:hypothetical protein